MFGNTVFGILASNPEERKTIQNLMYLAKIGSGVTSKYHLTPKVGIFTIYCRPVAYCFNKIAITNIYYLALHKNIRM